MNNVDMRQQPSINISVFIIWRVETNIVKFVRKIYGIIILPT